MSLKRIAKRLIDTAGLGVLVHNSARCLRYRLDRTTRARNRRFVNRAAPDGLPLPPPYLVYLTTDQFDLESFYHSGARGAECIRRILQKNNLEIGRFEAILDFGCGCGRVLRHWKALSGPRLYACDVNARLIQWCRTALPWAEVTTNRLTPGLPYDDETFDFIYCISVFTHLNETLQLRWLDELRRLLQPGGYLLASVHGRNSLAELNRADRQAFQRGELVVVRNGYWGSNVSGAFHPEPYVRRVFGENFEVVDFVPDGAEDARQDQVLLRKKT